MEKLLSLVLMDLSQSSVQACWEGRECVVLHVTSALMDLMYKWEFKLTRLPDEVVSCFLFPRQKFIGFMKLLDRVLNWLSIF